MSNSHANFARTTLKVRLVTLCAACIASAGVLGAVLTLFDSAGDAAKIGQANLGPTKVALATASTHASGRR